MAPTLALTISATAAIHPMAQRLWRKMLIKSSYDCPFPRVNDSSGKSGVSVRIWAAMYPDCRNGAGRISRAENAQAQRCGPKSGKT